jgi:soluble lytic murein transglycosylase-like protein
MKFLVAAVVFCVACPAAKEFPPIYKITFGEPAIPRLLSHAEIGELIQNAAEKHRLPPAFIKSIVAAESAFRSDAVSSKGALGLMQVMPETAQDMGLDASIPEQNIEAGTKYLKGLMGYYGKRRDWLKRTIAAYNAGPGNVDKYRGVPPFRETRAYVTRVLAYFKEYRRASGEPAHFRMLARQ